MSERLRSLKITEEASSKDEQIEIMISTAPVATNKNVQAGILKEMVLDPEWFDGDQMKFEDW